MRKLQAELTRDFPAARMVSEQWIGFTDVNGSGMCQPDGWIVFPTHIVLLECKLTQTPVAQKQMRELYVPVLMHIYGLPVICVQVVKNLICEPGQEVKGLKELTSLSLAGEDDLTWFWL